MTAAWLALAAYGSIYDHSPPPQRFRGDVTVTVRFESESKVESDCGAGLAPPPPGQHYAACNLPDGTMVLPNSCLHPLADETALTTCHEIGHANGWPKDHPPN